MTCNGCNGDGKVMEMVCYGGPPVERYAECPDCRGYGETDDPEESTSMAVPQPSIASSSEKCAQCGVYACEHRHIGFYEAPGFGIDGGGTLLPRPDMRRDCDVFEWADLCLPDAR